MQNVRPTPREGRRIGLARALSKQGLCSRATAVEWIVAGRVRVNALIVRDPEAPTTEQSRIEVDCKPLDSSDPIYIMLNKPRGLVTTAHDEHGRPTVYQCFQNSPLPWVAPVGRLDQASEGLLLFSNDPEWAAGLTDPARHVRKTYHVQIQGRPTPQTLDALCAGMAMENGDTLMADSAHLIRQGARNSWLEVVLTEGKNRHLRRLLAAADHPVLRLIRIAIGALQLGALAKGQWRYLREDELELVKAAATAATTPTR
jgi:23S rRNA pseudouridine2605 synthase